MKDFEVKVMLTEGQFKAIKRVADAKGMTIAGYFRNKALHGVADSENLVSQLETLTASDVAGKK